MNKYYKDHYDVIIVGGALAGLSAAIHLLDKGYVVLVLEQHNIPGGVATSFVRGGVELEASLHEMCSIGSERTPLKIRRLFDKYGINVDWMRVPDAFRYVTKDIDCVIRTGEDGDITIAAKDIAIASGDKDGTIYQKVLDFLTLCLKTHDAADDISENDYSKLQLLTKHMDFVKILGYSVKDVMDAYKIPKKAQQILSAYWMYLGSPMSDCTFLLYAYMISDYLGHGAYIPRHTSYEMSLKMAEKAMEKGAQIEFSQKVDKILVKDKKVYGVRLASGEEIYSDYVVAGPYPHTVYSKMIEPKLEVPLKAIKVTNSNELSASCFSIVMLLDKDYRELGITDYSTFYAPREMDIDKLFESGKDYNLWDTYAVSCTNVVDNNCTPKGTCFYSMTFIPKGETFKDMAPEQYQEYKKRIVDHFLEMEGNRLGINFKDHILEMVIETPISIAHYTGAYMGTIYGYRHMISNSSPAREEMEKDEFFIDGLVFAGAHQTAGAGMTPAIMSGIRAMKTIEDMRLKRNGGKK